MKVKVYLNEETVKTLLARKNVDYTWFAEKIGSSPTFVRRLVNGFARPGPKIRKKIVAAFSGSSLRSGRLKWDDLFTTVAVGTGGADDV
mgnify:FL=1